MKKKGLLIILFIFAILLIGFGSIYTLNSSNESASTEQKESLNDDSQKNVTILDKNSYTAKLLDLLKGYGETIYATKEYENFEKKDKMYFISLKELNEKYGYDISVFKGEGGKACNAEESGIYFDIDNVNNFDLSNGFKPILSTLADCQ